MPTTKAKPTPAEQPTPDATDQTGPSDQTNKPSQTDQTEQAADELVGLSYEQAREELARVVQQLESGGAPLAESLALWERGERLATLCQNWLDGAKATIEATAKTRAD